MFTSIFYLDLSFSIFCRLFGLFDVVNSFSIHAEFWGWQKDFGKSFIYNTYI